MTNKTCYFANLLLPLYTPRQWFPNVLQVSSPCLLVTTLCSPTYTYIKALNMFRCLFYYYFKRSQSMNISIGPLVGRKIVGCRATTFRNHCSRVGRLVVRRFCFQSDISKVAFKLPHLNLSTNGTLLATARSRYTVKTYLSSD